VYCIQTAEDIVWSNFFFGHVVPSFKYFDLHRRYPIPMGTPSAGTLNTRWPLVTLRGAEREESHFQADLLNNAGSALRSTTKFGRICEGGAYFPRSATPLPQGAGPEFRSFRVSVLFVHTNPLTQKYQIWHGITYGDGRGLF